MTLIECVCIIALIILPGVAMAGLLLWLYKTETRCRHSYERIDDCNDKDMVLVCRRCGKIKKLKK